MSGYPFDEFPSSPRKRLAGAARPSANPRIHAIAKPYSRPVSYSGPSTSVLSPQNQHELLTDNGISNGNGSPTKQSLPTTRPAILSSQSQRGMPRSGSESSLFGSLKGLISKPLSWLATPRSSKRDQSTWAAGVDSEDPESPSVKKLRKHSPPRQKGAYDPPSVAGKGKQREMLPPLPDLAGGLKKLPTSKTLATLPHSQSMPYLDPPSGLLSPPKKAGAITRSRGMNLASLANDEEDEPVIQGKDSWSPWRNQTGQSGRSRTPVKQSNRGSISEVRDYALPSLSPFRAPPSPSVARGLSRSATANNLRRGESIASDISMGRQSNTARQAKGSSSMLFGAPSETGDREDAMSIDGGERTRDRSVTDWFMRDRWSKEPSSPQVQRFGSLAPSSSMPPIRKGQLVWDSDKGFVRESELKSANVPPVQQNQAERILFALESMRQTPLADARKSAPAVMFPSDLIGASSRQIRRAINVPLATAQAGESARQRRDKERLGGDDRVSVMISPYGRRRAVDSEMRERSVGTDFPPSKSPSRSRSQATDHDMRSAHTPTPEPVREPSPEPTPRRSSRLRKNEAEETPRQSKSKGKGSIKNAAIETSAPKDTGRRRRKATAEPASPDREAPPPVPPVPTITETAPSPSEKSNGSSFQPRAEGSQPRQQSSLRARTEKTKRAHGSSAHGSRATSPTAGGRYSAREEDLPDMEELEQTKITLPSFSGVSFGNFGLPPPAAPAAQPTQKTDNSLSRPPAPASSSLGVPARGPLSRLNASRPRASSPLAAGSIVAEPDSPEAQKTKEPKPISKPDASGFFALSNSKPSAPATSPAPLFGSAAPPDSSKKPAFSFGLGKPSAPPPAVSTPPASESGAVPDFFGRKSAPDSGTATPVVAAAAPFTFGAKPAETSAEPTKATTPTFSFGTTPAPPTEKLAPIGSFTFGAKPSEPASKPPATTTPAPTSGGFNFGAPASTAKPAEGEKPAVAAFGGFNFGAKPADKPATGTGAPSMFGAKPAESPKPVEGNIFSFGQPSSTTSATASPVAAPTPTFSFGAAPAPTESAKAAETPKAVSFGAASPSAAEPAKAAFSFGAPATPKPAENKSTGFSFGQSSGSTTPAGSPFGGGFGATKASEPPKAAAPASNGFTFGAPADNKSNGTGASGFGQSSNASAASSPSFSFGAPAGAPAAPSNPFGGAAASPAQTGTPFGFGGTGNPPAAASTFGTTPQPASQAPGGFGGFGFNANNGTATAAPAFGAASTPSTAPVFGFGQSTAPPTPTSTSASFTFGAPAQAAQPSFGGFGASAQPQSTKRFGSPAPSATPPPDGGFSLGMESANPPGSPSGRKIKPLRRGTKR